MTRNNACVCGSGNKQKQCHPDVHPESKIGKLLDVYRRTDELIREYRSTHSDLTPCHEGCYSCCFDLFSITGYEFKLISRDLRTWPQQQLVELYRIVQKQWQEWLENHPRVCFDLEGESDRFHSQIKHAPNFTKSPCPLLGEKNGQCRVYASRPSICRFHGTTHHQFIQNDFVDDFEVCQHIPSGKEHKHHVPDATALYQEVLILNTYTTNSVRNQIRMYPILYWLRLSLLPNGYLNLPNETRDFRIPAETSDRIR